MGKGFFVFEIGRLAYRSFEDSDHWHLGITSFADDGPDYDKILDLTFIRLGCFYWRTTPGPKKGTL